MVGYKLRIVSGRVELQFINTPSVSGPLRGQLLRNVDAIPLFSGNQAGSLHFKVSVRLPILAVWAASCTIVRCKSKCCCTGFGQMKRRSGQFVIKVAFGIYITVADIF